MARAWCVLKPGGKALIGFPIGPEKDQILFNGNKNYGPVMLPHIFANWKQIHSELDYKKFHPTCPWCYEEVSICCLKLIQIKTFKILRTLIEIIWSN